MARTVLLLFFLLHVHYSRSASLSHGMKEKAWKLHDSFLVPHYEALHQIPEVGFELPQTHAYVTNVLKSLNVKYEALDNLGIIATIGTGNAPIIGLRADMDGLPVKEETGLPYASTNGNMHGCGHDAHTTMLLGAAKLLKEMETSLTGEIRLVFQPAEELIQGAQSIVDTGKLDDLSVIFGFHVAPQIAEPGHAVAHPGTAMAATSTFHGKIIGEGTHGSAPHTGIDPHIAMANVILGYQTIISRRMDALKSDVISVTMVNGGTTHNVIPETVSFSGTLRNMANEDQEIVQNIMKNMTVLIAASYECEAELEFPVNGPSLYNDPATTAFATEVAKSMLGDANVVAGTAVMGSEDFAAYTEKVPAGVFMFLTCGNSKETGGYYAVHNPRFTIDNRMLHIGAALHVELVLNYQKGHTEIKTEL